MIYTHFLEKLQKQIINPILKIVFHHAIRNFILSCLLMYDMHTI